jgi:hypothetical protein
MDNPRSLGPRAVAGAAPWVALAGILLFLRYPDWFRRPRLWAEDGPVFFLAARRDGPASVVEPYAGYLHLIPRLVALLGSRLDPSLIPAFYVCSALAVTLLVVARVFSRRLELPCKPLLALAIVAVPHTGEVFLTVTNLQWVVALALVMTLMMRDPGSAAGLIGDAAILVLAGLTGPFSVLLFPFFLLRAVWRASPQSWALCTVVLAAALVQGRLIFMSPPSGLTSGAPGPRELSDLAGVLLSRVPLALVGAQGWMHRVSHTFMMCAGWAGAAGAAMMACARGPCRRERVCLFLLAVLLALSVAARICGAAWDWRDMVSADRYFYLPRVLLIWIAISLLSRRSAGAAFPLALPVALGLYCVSMVSYVEPYNFGMRHVERPWVAWDIYSGRLRTGKEVSVQVSPSWAFVVPASTPAR